MEKSKDPFANYKEQRLTKPRDEAWGNWQSWKDAQVGDKIQGYIRDAFYRPEELNPDGSVAFKAQRGITLETLDGELVNVGIKYLPFVLSATDNLRIGDPLTIELSEIRQPAAKGQNGAKVFTYYGTNLPENENNPTVKELTEEDKRAGGSSQAEEEDSEIDKQFDEIAGDTDKKENDENAPF